MSGKGNNIIDSFRTVLIVIAILWAVLLVSFFVPLTSFGIRPRTVTGLVGIFFAPFLHAGISHLVANSVSLLILGTVFLTTERKLSFLIVAHFIIIGGFGTWLIGRAEFVHIGASGVIYAILGYLIFNGIFQRNLRTLLISVAVFIFYGGAIWGVLPTGGFVSWESHLCGFLAGIITSRIYAGSRR